MLKNNFKTVIVGLTIIALMAFAFIGCAIENPRTPGTTTIGGTITTPRITGTTTMGGTTTTPRITGTTGAPGTTGTPIVTTGTITGTGAGTTTTRGRARIDYMPRYGARNGADNSGMLFGSAPDLYTGNAMFQGGYLNGLHGNNGYPYGNPTGKFKDGYPNNTYGNDGYSEYAYGYNGYWNDRNFYADVGGNVDGTGYAGRLTGNIRGRGRVDNRGFFGFNTPGVNQYNNNSVMSRIDQNNQHCKVADDIKRDVKGMREVRDAEVCVTDDSVFVGIKPGIYANDINSLKGTIEDKIRTKFPQAQNVNITNDNLDMQTIRRAYAKMKNSNIDASRLDNMLQVVRDNIAVGGKKY